MTGWLMSAILLTLLVVVAFVCRRLRNQLRRERAESARLADKLSEARAKWAEVNRRRKKLLAASTQALVIVERDYKISNANKMAKRLFGKPDKNSTLMAWTRQHRLQELVDQVLQGKKMPPLYLSLGERSLEAHARSIKGNKHVVAVALAIHEVTELQRLSRARRDFVANISHELRTPIASLQLLTETLLHHGLDNKEMALKLIDKIGAQTDILSQLAQELLDLSMIESGQVLLKMAPYSLQSIAQAQVERLLPQAERKNVALKMEIDEDITVLVDETMIGRVITNLIHNAIKFTETGWVTISARPANGIEPDSTKDEGDGVTVSISDTGIGIPPNELSRVFERFYKVDQARSRQRSGTGMGLAIAKHIVEAHGGHIWAESDGESGATFHFTLPLDNTRLKS